MAAFHIAQLNIGRMLAPLDSSQLAGFVEALEPINALADRAPGFVWRLEDEDSGNATSIRPFDDDMLIVNMSVWTSLEALTEFVYVSDHRAVMQQRRKWFERMGEAFVVLWWVPAGHIPDLDEAEERLDLLRSRGPSPDAFTFKKRFAPGVAIGVDVDESWASPPG